MEKKIITLLIAISFSIVCYSQITPPSINSFDNVIDTTGWSHYAISGTDDWMLGVPATYNFTAAHSPPNLWATNLTGSYAPNSNRALETPYYNLTDTSKNLILSFNQKRKSLGTAYYYFEYSNDHGSTWQLLNDAATKKDDWQIAIGFNGNNEFSWQKSAIDIRFIQGQDSVKFRFRYVSTTDNEAGWIIDNFSIVEEYYNIAATQGDSITGLNKYFTDFTVESSFPFSNQWASLWPPYSFTFQSDFYLSTDLIIDGADILLGSVNNTLNTSLSNWDNTFNLPPNLPAGTYYVIYEMDALNVLDEANETDNISHSILIIDSIYAAPYNANFDTTYQIWNAASNATPSTWFKGDPNGWHVEDARSGNNAWVSKDSQLGFTNYLESPYLDLSTSTGTVLCLWYRTSTNSWFGSQLSIHLPFYGNTIVTQPSYSSSVVNVPHSRLYTWDCYCTDLSDLDGELSTKIRFSGSGNTTPTSLSQALIDDVYIGEARPDAAIESYKTNRYTSASSSIDTLDYLFFNSGLSSLTNTITEFYWSTDTILDGGDILLGSNSEASLSDTSYRWTQFIYSKPTNASGKYYIFYKVDAANQVTEMREFDNIGYFEIYQDNPENLPYFNDFETSITSWRHNSSLGENQWVWGTPQGTYIDSAFSGTKAFITNDTGIVSQNSRMHLFTPQFNLTQLQNPVMEFDLLAQFYGVNGYNSWPFNMGNIMYSINGGATWEVLDSTNLSFKRLYYRLELETIGGNDRIPTNLSASYLGELLYGKNLPTFRTEQDYQGRDYNNNHHYVVDLSFIKQAERIQFMFVYANYDAPMEGMMMDNFEIVEAKIDLMKSSKKKLLVSSSDQKIKQNIVIENNGNYISDSTSVNIYCSTDTILDGSDANLGLIKLRAIRPYENSLTNINLSSPLNYGSYNYLLLEIDPSNLNIESNETNNITYYELNMDTSVNFSYPILYDFNGDEVNGWTWYHDSTGYTSRHGHRFRHKLVIKDRINYGQSGEWFLDPIDQLGYYNSIAGYPNHYLETPPYDFSTLSNIELEFDFMCIGDDYSFGSGTQGGNFQYSIDGGLTWIILTTTQDPLAQNWYDLITIASLSNEPGWSIWPGWTTAKYNLSFLSGNSSIRFRFKFRSENLVNSTYYQGFRLDNFKVNAAVTTILPPISICQNDSVLIYGNYQNTAGIYYDSLQTVNGSDSILSTTAVVNPTYTFSQNHTICIGDSILLGGSYQTINGTYLDTLQTVNGCDSIISTTLFVGSVFTSNQNSTICQNDSILLSGIYQNTAGIYYDSLQTIHGCDSIISTTLSINPLPSVSLDDFNPDTLCLNTSLVTLPNGTPSSGSYSGNGVIGVNFDPSIAGIGTHYIIYTYTDGNSCINSDTTIVTINLCTGIENINTDFGIIIYPNPSTGKFTIEKPNDLNKEVQIRLLDATSKLILDKVIPIGKQKIEMDIRNYSKGIYYLQLIIENEIFVKQILKN